MKGEGDDLIHNDKANPYHFTFKTKQKRSGRKNETGVGQLDFGVSANDK